jgi:PDDEXK-like domain of unknown function (DUF3799)
MTIDRAVPKLGDGYVHFSNLKYIARSAAHYRVACERRLEPTPAMRFGSLVHAIVLGGDYVVWRGTRRGKDWETFALEHTSRLIVTEDELLRAQLVADAVLRHPRTQPWLRGIREQHVLWEYQGRACSSRLDVSGEDFIADLKVTTNTDPETLQRACAKMAYHAQLAFYALARRSIGLPVEQCAIVAVESAPPFEVTILRLTARTLEIGTKLVRLWMERLLACEAVDQWPGYVQTEVDWEIEESRSLALIDGEPVDDAA